MKGPRPFLIGGQWHQGETVAPVHDPFTGKVLAEVSQASQRDAEVAIQSTVEAAAPMGALPSHARYHLLQKIAGLIYDRREEFAQVMTGES
ncbi:MAG TPA: aldehyde dehydrogenase family protein, partial [Nitrospira sp.]